MLRFLQLQGDILLPEASALHCRPRCCDDPRIKAISFVGGDAAVPNDATHKKKNPGCVYLLCAAISSPSPIMTRYSAFESAMYSSRSMTPF